MSIYKGYIERSECKTCGKRNYRHADGCPFLPNNMAALIERLNAEIKELRGEVEKGGRVHVEIGTPMQVVGEIGF